MNDISNDPFFEKRSNLKFKMMYFFQFSVGILMGSDTGSKGVSVLESSVDCQESPGHQNFGAYAFTLRAHVSSDYIL